MASLIMKGFPMGKNQSEPVVDFWNDISRYFNYTTTYSFLHQVSALLSPAKHESTVKISNEKDRAT